MSNTRLLVFSGLLAFNGGFTDVVCFFGLKGLFAAHVTGNLATLCVSLVLGTAGLLSKMAAVPEFMIVVALTHAIARVLTLHDWSGPRILFGAEALLLALFLALSVRHGPFGDPDSLIALTTALAAIAAMAVQNGAQLSYLPDVPPTTFMTGNAAQASIDIIDVLAGSATAQQKRRFARIGLNLACFALGSAIAALTFWRIGFWSGAITLSVAILAAALTP
jgi:uncharacterized membrane protein YoaK (UPF0700 family)